MINLKIDRAVGEEVFDIFEKYNLDDTDMLLVVTKLLAAIYCFNTNGSMEESVVQHFLNTHEEAFRDGISQLVRATEGHREGELQ